MANRAPSGEDAELSRRVVLTLGGVSAISDACYVQALEQAAPAIEIVPLYPHASAEDVRDVLAAASGLVLSGGADVHPARYGEVPAGAEMRFVSEARDAMEFAALAAADARGIPVLAICRGVQVLNVHRGGALLQDMGQSHRDGRPQEEKWRPFHTVEVEPASRLAGVLGSPTAEVNSRHHQALDPARIGAGLRATGRCPADGIIEAVEGDGPRFVLGVQWHPENMAIGPAEVPSGAQARAVFAAFAAALADPVATG